MTTDDFAAAAKLIMNADFLLISAGAGFSADAGLPTYDEIANVDAYRRMGLTYGDLCDPVWVRRDPEIFYGFWGGCYNAYQDTSPHDGYGLAQDLAVLVGKRRRGGDLPVPAHVYTSNVDNLFVRTGWPESQVTEIHGNCLTWQCAGPCCQKVFRLPSSFKFDVNTSSQRATLPAAPASLPPSPRGRGGLHDLGAIKYRVDPVVSSMASRDPVVAGLFSGLGLTPFVTQKKQILPPQPTLPEVTGRPGSNSYSGGRGINGLTVRGANLSPPQPVTQPRVSTAQHRQVTAGGGRAVVTPPSSVYSAMGESILSVKNVTAPPPSRHDNTRQRHMDRGSGFIPTGRPDTGLPPIPNGRRPSPFTRSTRLPPPPSRGSTPIGPKPTSAPSRPSQSNHPRCPSCFGPARPNVLMFDDGEWVEVPETGYTAWINGVWRAMKADKTRRMVILEMGCGVRVPTIRQTSNRLVSKGIKLGGRVDLVRINPVHFGNKAPRQKERTVSLKCGAKEGLERIVEEIRRLGGQEDWDGPSDGAVEAGLAGLTVR